MSPSEQPDRASAEDRGPLACLDSWSRPTLLTSLVEPSQPPSATWRSAGQSRESGFKAGHTFPESPTVLPKRDFAGSGEPRASGTYQVVEGQVPGYKRYSVDDSCPGLSSHRTPTAVHRLSRTMGVACGQAEVPTKLVCKILPVIKRAGKQCPLWLSSPIT